mgnify:CR=1 FL=1|jgi:hypothetical protein
MENEQAVIQQEQAGQPVTTPNMADSVGSTQAQDADLIAANEALRRQKQSQQDKEAAEIAKRYKAWKAAGNSGTVEQMLQNPQAIQSQPGTAVQESASAAKLETQTGQQPDPVIQKAVFLMEEYAGGQIPEDAPEFQMINKETKDPAEFLESIRTASITYAKRTANLSNPARIPSLAGGAGAHVPPYANLTATEGLNQYFAEWRKKNIR